MHAHHRARGRDLGVTEVISYVFMLGLGAIALIVSMAVLTETQDDTNTITIGIQLKQAGQITSAHLQEAARVASVAPDASYNMTFQVPQLAGGIEYSVNVTPHQPAQSCEARNLTLATNDGRFNVTVPLGNAGKVQVDGACLFDQAQTGFHSSFREVRVQYLNPTSGNPRILLSPNR